MRRIIRSFDVLLAFIIILLPLFSMAQEYEYVPFPDSGAVWSEVYYTPESFDSNTQTYICIPPIYERFTVIGEDTIIDEITYKKLYMFYDTVFSRKNAKYIGGIREDENKRIYFNGDTIVHFFKTMNNFDKNKEIILFDFSVNVGDTIKESNFFNWFDDLIVKDIDTIQIGNILRKRFHFEHSPSLKWIEGIGGSRGLLFTSGDLPINGLHNDLICFKQNAEVLYFDDHYTECMPLLTKIETVNKSINIKLFPNPAKEHNIKFTFGQEEILELQIIGSKGQLYGRYKTKMQSYFDLSIENYQSGIYFYKATNKKGIVLTGKFVVQ